MPTQTDLAGLGMSGPLAEVLGNQALALTATGSAQTDAALIKSSLISLTATGADGAILPILGKIGTPYWVFNVSGSTGLVYCPVGHTMNTSSNGSLSVTTHKLAVFVQVSKGVWGSMLTA